MNRVGQITNCAISQQLHPKMTRTAETLELSEAEANDVAYTLREIKPEDIDMEWINTMVNRLSRQLEKQLKSVEKYSAAAKPLEVERFLKNARTLSTIQKTLAELIDTKIQSDAIRATKAARKPKDVRKKLAKQISGEPQQGGEAKLPEQPE